MKKLILISALLFSFNGWAEEDITRLMCHKTAMKVCEKCNWFGPFSRNIEPERPFILDKDNMTFVTPTHYLNNDPSSDLIESETYKILDVRPNNYYGENINETKVLDSFVIDRTTFDLLFNRTYSDGGIWLSSYKCRLTEGI